VVASNELWGPTCISILAEPISEKDAATRIGGIIQLIDGIEHRDGPLVFYRTIIRTSIVRITLINSLRLESNKFNLIRASKSSSSMIETCLKVFPPPYPSMTF
jgi:hypothetical protein